MHSITVLMSTYNGEKYIREQIDSVLNQNGVQLSLLIRDDGSTDSTISILKQYDSIHQNITFYKNENMGPAKSFIDLIKTADETEYYAFCDQDDVWDENKLIKAIEALECFPEEKPNLYYSNLRIVDQDLNFYRLSHSSALFNENKFSALAENLCTGCTAVFNLAAKRIIAERPPEYCTMHDTWLYMVCKIMGNTYYDEQAYISYRQHGNNVVGAYLKEKRFNVLKERFLRLFERDLQPRYTNARYFYEAYGTMLSEYDKTKILKVVNYKSSLRARMDLFFDKDIKASTKYGNIRFRLHILWGTV